MVAGTDFFLSNGSSPFFSSWFLVFRKKARLAENKEVKGTIIAALLTGRSCFVQIIPSGAVMGLGCVGKTHNNKTLKPFGTNRILWYSVSSDDHVWD